MITNGRVLRMNTTQPIIFWIATFAVATNRPVAAGALVVALLATSLSVQAARSNQAATAAAGDMSSGATAMRNAAGMGAYRSCCYNMGIRP
ncbi:hypothetical protein Q2941_27355 [Bradyrhizobium sp. UFLA05-153]